MNEVIMLPAIYEGSRDLKDKTKKLVFQTNEITPEQAGKLQLCVQQFVYLAIKKESFEKEQLNLIQDCHSEIDDHVKTPSQRLRGALYRLWQQENEGYEDFNLYYNFKIEWMIKYIKSKLL